MADAIDILLRFQSTLPHRERLIIYVLRLRILSFNPRSHAGSDMKILAEQTDSHLFQSTLPRRERRGVYLTKTNVTKFQSTLPHGEQPIALVGPPIKI